LTIRGVVVEGCRLGRELGAPTANVELAACSEDAYGSYAAEVVVGRRRHRALAHVGVRPSVHGDGPLLEVHLLDANRGDGTVNLYGESISVRLLEKVAGESRLSSLDALKHKIHDDLRRVKAYFAARGPRANERR
jgi:riboflavin kinase/FMN adenylyltransferase